MSALIIQVAPHRGAAYVLSDAGSWSPKGMLVDICSKIHRLPGCTGISIGTGSHRAIAEFNRALGDRSFDECVALAGQALRDCKTKDTRMFLVGISEKPTRQAEAWLISTTDYDPVQVTRLITPRPDGVKKLARFADPATEGLALMEHMREFRATVPWGRMSCVAGFCELATVSRQGVQIETLKHWPDVVVPSMPETLEARVQRSVRAEEMLFTVLDTEQLQDRVITIDGDINNINLRSLHDSIYPALVPDDIAGYDPMTVTFIINTSVKVGSALTSLPAVDVGTWLTGFVPKLVVIGRIQGAGGKGADGNGNAVNGPPGGIALYTRHPLDLTDLAGQIWGGGGGGGAGAGGGGGGAGTVPGAGGSDPVFLKPGSPGTSEAGGFGGDHGGLGHGGDGGNPGLVGGNATDIFGGLSGVGGAAGPAIDGISFVSTVSGPGDRRGGQVN